MNLKNKKIAIVHDFLVRFWWAEQIVKNFAENFPNAKIFTLFYDEKKMWKFFKNKTIHTSSLQKFYKMSFWKYTHLLPFMSEAIEEFDFSKYDLVFSSSAAFSHWIITNPETKHISYVHAPARWAWDYYFKFSKEKKMWFLKKFLFSKMISKFREWDFIASFRPDINLAASKDVQKRIQKFWKKDSTVVYPFADLKNFTPIKNPTKDYFLVVSQLVAYKKIDEIIKAFNKFWKKLLIVWEWPEKKNLEKFAGKNIEFVGWKNWKDLEKIYQNAKAFVFAWIDDFWITPIESMACGVPVVAFFWWGAKETILDWETWYFFHEQNSISLLKVLETKNLEKLSWKDCIKQAEKFSKEKFVKNILREIEK